MRWIWEGDVNFRQGRTLTISQVVVTLFWSVLTLWSWLSIGPMWITAMRPKPDKIIDFYQDWSSAHNYWSGLPIYTPHSLSIPRYLGLPSNPDPSIEYNMHPPTSVLLVLPFGRLDYSDAALVWNLISLVALLASVVIVARMLSLPRSLILAGLVFLPLCFPVLGNLQMGQLNIILCFLLTATWALERSGQSGKAGLLLGTATAIKLFPAYLVVYYVAQGKGRLLWAATLSLLFLTLMSAIILSLNTYHDYAGIVLPWHAQSRILGYNISIDGLWHKLFCPFNPCEKIIPLWQSAAVARWGTRLSNLAVTAIVATFAYRAQMPSQQDLAFAITVTAMLLVSPVTWDISLILLLAPISIIGSNIRKAQAKWLRLALVLILPIIWLPQPLLTNLVTGGQIIEIAPPSFLLGAASLKFYALLGIFVLGLAALRYDKLRAHHRAAGRTAIV